MEPTNRHPLECITNKSGLSMLECLIPYVDYPLKLPLALFIKFNEIRMIINAFQSFESIAGLGLNAASNSPTDMLCALTGMSPDMINAIMSMSSNRASPFSPDQLFNLSGMSFNSSKGAGHGNSLDENISNIFEEYDMEQAEKYMQQNPPTYDTSNLYNNSQN